MAEKMPIGMPVRGQMIDAPTPSVIDTGNLRAISSLTGTKFPYE
jgi:hypothetical protein